jgi:ketosteroid isomerase-like protein
MSQENVEIVQRMFEQLNRGDIAGCAEAMSEDVLCVTGPDQPDAEVLRGREGFVGYCRSWLEAFGEYEADTTELLDRGDFVVVVGRVRARGRSSGATVEEVVAWLFRLRGGEVVEYRGCRSKAEALEAGGLSE